MDTGSPQQPTSVPRVSQACERCRSKRVRCSGERPCERCQRQGEECSFGYARGARRQSILSALDQHNNRQKLATNLTEPSSFFSDALPSLPAITSTSSTSHEISPTIGHDEWDSGPSIDGTTDSPSASPFEASRPPNPKSRPTSRKSSRKTRISYACLECKKRRRKCTGDEPCQTCIDVQAECIYDPSGDRRSKAYYQRRLADGFLNVMQSDTSKELISLLQQNANLDLDTTFEIQRALRLAENSGSSSTADPEQKLLSLPAVQGDRLICKAYCGLRKSGSSRSSWYPHALQEKQELLINGPNHLIFPHVIDDSSPLSRAFTNFANGVRELLQQGMPLVDVLGPLDPAVDLVFRARTPRDLFTTCTWASELARNLADDVYTQLANVFLLARYMRWILSPTLENFILLPEIMRPTLLQRTVPHFASADLFPLPAIRDCLTQGGLELGESLDADGRVGIKFHWPFDVEKAVDTDPVTGGISISRLFGACAAEAKNWSCSRDFLGNVPMTKGLINLIEHQHGWHSESELSLLLCTRETLNEVSD